MRARSSTDPEFIQEAERVLGELSEIVCLIWFSHAAGNRSYEFFDDVRSFRQRLAELPAKTSVIVFEQRQFPIRGIADDDLVARALMSISDGQDWTIARTSLITMGSQSWYHHYDGNSLKELEEELRDSFFWGHPVALGLEPDWIGEKTVEAIVPGENGKVERGVY